MLAVLYFVFAWYIGFGIIKKLVPYLFQPECPICLVGQKVKLKSWMILLPGSFLVGILIMTWFTYLTAFIFRKTKDPLLLGNIFSMTIFLLLTAWLFIKNKDKYRDTYLRLGYLKRAETFLRSNKVELIFILIISIVWTFFMFRSLNIKNNILNVGFSVYSDFGPHLSVIRSFSHGSNFPTEYPHFADCGIRYHFMFQFLAGNLEYLGLRLDWAFNLPSILSIISFQMLLYSFAMLIFNNRLIGILTSVFFFFRSSFAFFTFAGQFDSLKQAITEIMLNTTHIGRTTHEDWGLWAQKVYLNQRHFAFGLGVFILIMIAFLPLFIKMIERLNSVTGKSSFQFINRRGKQIKKGGNKGLNKSLIIKDSFAYLLHNMNHKMEYWLKEFVFLKNAWLPLDFMRCILCGIIMGLLSFWNGAVVIAGLGVLFVIAAWSKHRLEYLIFAIVTITLSYLESIFFIGIGNKAVEPKITIGFLADSKDIMGILKYYIELLGILPYTVVAALFVLPKGGRLLTLAFFSPLVLATTLQLTPDITVNHKYVIIGVLLMSIVSAHFVCCLFKTRRITASIIACVIIAVMTVTGLVDIITLYNIDRNKVAYRTDDPLIEWIINNTGHDETFLTDAYCLHPILLAGRRIFYGWPYFAWSAGYNTDERAAIVREIYGGNDIDRSKELIKKYNIRYIVVENSNRQSTDYSLNEEFIKNNFEMVYSQGPDLAIYSTQ